jgi:uncharacterized membrane protein
MDFLLWTVRGIHVFALVIWLGGFLYESAVVLQSSQVDQSGSLAGQLREFRRFVPFVWMSLWTLLVTGIALMLFSPRFVFFQLDDLWSVFLVLKQVGLVLLLILSFGYSRMCTRAAEALGGSSDQATAFMTRIHSIRKAMMVLGILTILFASGMMIGR